jgi:hypothetical protein
VRIVFVVVLGLVPLCESAMRVQLGVGLEMEVLAVLPVRVDPRDPTAEDGTDDDSR